MKDVIIDTLLDTVKLIPFLLIAFLIIEVIEHKLSKKSKNIITKSGKYGPVLGGILGLFPQCGFSVMATNLYVTRIISIGTLVAIYLSTSDEMLPILLSHDVDWTTIAVILSIKLFVGIIFGFIIDLLIGKKYKKLDYHICEEEHCHCDEEGVIYSSIMHTVKIVLFILIANFLLNTLIYLVGEETISKFFLKDNIFGPFISSLVGLIPNCAASVIITELYLSSAISFGSLISGLLTGSGVALLFLFKSNKNIKENFSILGIIYSVGVITGIIIDVVNMIL